VILLHLKDGKTITFDLEEGASEWQAKLARPDLQSQLTAVTIKMSHRSKGSGDSSVQYSVVKPQGFDGATQWFQVELVKPSGRIHGGERLDLFIGDVRVSLMAHKSQPAARISITRMGRRIFNPQELQR
jgi:hypothetical protein